MFFFFNDTATTEIYTLSLHDALPISDSVRIGPGNRIPMDYQDRHRSIHRRGRSAGPDVHRRCIRGPAGIEVRLCDAPDIHTAEHRPENHVRHATGGLSASAGLVALLLRQESRSPAHYPRNYSRR